MGTIQIMPVQAHLLKRGFSSRRAQAMIEFAIVAPILFLLLFGLIEVGRMMFLYASVTNASREAVRWGSAVGLDDDGVLRYKNCQAIETIARNASFSSTAVVEIYYDTGPSTSTTQCTTSVYPGFRKSGDRIKVVVRVTYKPYTKLAPWGQRDFEAISYRTILGYIALPSTPSGGGGGGGGGGSSTDTPTPTATDTAGPSPTPTDTPTATATFSGEFETPTPTPTSTEGPSPTPTDTPAPTDTPTETPTETPTPSPTATATLVPGCDQIAVEPILVSYNYMAMSITNPHAPATVSSVRVIWNAGAGASSPDPLSLQSALLNGLFWTGKDSTGDRTIPTVSNSVTIPGNNTNSTIFFTFDQEYENPNGSESITITLSGACEGITIQSPSPTSVP